MVIFCMWNCVNILPMKRYDIIVIGGGAAGLMAAGRAAELGASVLLAEKMGSLGRKVLISGSGRCNITNTINSTKEMVNHFGKKGKFLYQAFNGFSNADTVKFFNAKGMETSVDKGFKVFPASDMSEEVLSVLTRYVKGGGVEILQGAALSVVNTSRGKVKSVSIGGDDIECSAVIIATGGKSYPKTGSSGDGYKYAESLGHTMVDPLPALVPVYVKEGWVKAMQGMSVRNGLFSIYQDNKRVAKEQNDAVFTENGLSGPAIYNLSRVIDTSASGFELRVDFRPDVEYSELDNLVASAINDNGGKSIKNVMSSFFMPKMLPVALDLCGLGDGSSKAGNLGRDGRKKLVGMLKNMSLTVDRFAGFERAVVTKGGISLKEIDGKTMESKVVKGLYFAGEVIDLDGPTGGFNLQLCWSTGRLAGESSAKKVLS